METTASSAPRHASGGESVLRIAPWPPVAAPPPPVATACWTVRRPGKTPAPKSDDYTSWTIDQLRKECSERRAKIKRTTPGEKHERVSWLQQNDVSRLHVHAIGDAESAPPGPLLDHDKPPRTTIPLDTTPRSPVDVAVAVVGAKRGRAADRDAASGNSDGTRKTSRQQAAAVTSAPSWVSSAPGVGASSTGKRGALSVLECLSKSYAILTQLRAMRSDEESSGQRHSRTTASIALHEVGVRQLESEYASLLAMRAIIHAGDGSV